MPESDRLGGERSPPEADGGFRRRARQRLRWVVWIQVGLTGLTGWAIRHEAEAPTALLILVGSAWVPCFLGLPVVALILAHRAGLGEGRRASVWLIEVGICWAYYLAFIPAVQ